jgi:hypothetical protein
MPAVRGQANKILPGLVRAQWRYAGDEAGL